MLIIFFIFELILLSNFEMAMQFMKRQQLEQQEQQQLRWWMAVGVVGLEVDFIIF
jgi:hypothetical protein